MPEIDWTHLVSETSHSDDSITMQEYTDALRRAQEAIERIGQGNTESEEVRERRRREEAVSHRRQRDALLAEQVERRRLEQELERYTFRVDGFPPSSTWGDSEETPIYFNTDETSSYAIQRPTIRPRRDPPQVPCSAEGCGRVLPYNRVFVNHDGSNVCEEHFVRMDYCRGCDRSRVASTMGQADHNGFPIMLCAECMQQRTDHCSSCGVLAYSRSLAYSRRPGPEFVCRSCLRLRTVGCVSCGDSMQRSEARVSRDLGGFACESCFSSYDDSRIQYEVVDGEERSSVPFGIEIETEFRYGCPFELNGYHAHDGAPRSFIHGWRAETDSSLSDGGEFISPPLDGMRGMAEVLWTYNMLREQGARISSRCGQHISLSNFVARADYAPKVQLLTMALEEALFALGGDLDRCLHNRYCVRLKEHDTEGLFKKIFNQERRVPAYIKGRDVVEFRYPPGTLSPADLAINLGLTQMVIQTAQTIEEDELEALARECLDAGNIHDRVMVGLRFITGRGWYPGSQFEGLPYNPHVHTEVAFRDSVNGHNDVVIYPTSSEIIDRMVDNIQRFYETGINGSGHFNAAQMDQAIAEILG